MELKQKLCIAGGLTASLLGAVIYFNLKRKGQDKKAGTFLRKLSEIIKPETAGLLSEQAFDIHYTDELLKRVTGSVIKLKTSAANDLATVIHSAFQPWYYGGDDENKIYGVFRKLKDKVQVSQVAAAYEQVHGVNLLDKFNERLGGDEIAIILNIVKALPSHRRTS